jgi:immunity protein 8 of polymorphic toxin system
MKAIVRRFHSPDALDLDNYVPDDPEDDAILLQVMVGSADVPGEESFDVLVCTPRWLEREVKAKGPLIGRHYLIVEATNYPGVRRFLTKIIENQMAGNWEELANRVGRIGMWEFEDYVPCRD